MLINGSLDLSALPRIPVRPTHSRHNSFSDMGAEVLASLGGASPGPPSSSGASQPSSPMTGFTAFQVKMGVCMSGGGIARWGRVGGGIAG